ncbi:MAG: FlgD immunoglobulin-like domain containing protein [Candidatus Zixiibacteriota bacterium]
MDSPSRAKPGGDLNGDGYDDLITSYPLESSSFSYVDIFYGGPSVDSIPDLRINVWEMPEYLLKFGMGIAGLGDVNGDGVNDFSASGVDAYGHGVVYIFSGNKSGTAVDSDDNFGLPSTFSLHPAYPNPFNPSTTISFDLPKRAEVKLIVFDLLGREVRKLVDQEMAAGAHSVKWDGTNEAGKAVASGVYFFKMTAGEFEKSVKGMLVK